LCVRRLILEVTEKELSKVGIELPHSKNVKSLELLYFLKQDQQEFAAISEINFKERKYKNRGITRWRLLSRYPSAKRQKNGAYIVFLRSGPSLSSVLSSIGIESGYLFPPLGIADGKVKFFIPWKPTTSEGLL